VSSHPATPGIELTKPRRKALSSLGHQIVRLAAACDRLRMKGGSFPELAPWLRSDSIRDGSSISGDGFFACPLVIDGARLTLYPLAAPAGQCAAVLPALPSAVREQAGVLTVPASLNDPLWPALLHLRPLRDFWERELRRATVAALLDLLPDAWLLDPTPLPPGSVIPRLELDSWNSLDVASRRFIPPTFAEITARLSAHPDAPGVLTSPPEISPRAVPFLSLYLKSDARVDWLGAVPAD